MPTAAEAVVAAAKREIERRKKLQVTKARCEEDLLYFGRKFWHILEPTTPLVEGWVLRTMCDVLMAVTDGHHQKVLFNIPPGSGKSLWLNVLWPSWEWGPQDMAHMRYLSASYSQGLPERDNARFSRLINSEEYQQLWGDRVKLIADGKELVENARTGWKRVTSTRSGTTGHRADRVLCLPYESRILTSAGWMQIGDIVSERRAVLIAGWDGFAVRWQRIEAYQENPPDQLVEVAFDGGAVRLTGNHELWVIGRGYVAAADVRPGDTLLHHVQRSGGTGRDEVLLSEVQREVSDGGGARGKHPAVHGLSDAILHATSAPRSEQEWRDVQPSLLGRSEYRPEQSSVPGWRDASVMRILRQGDATKRCGGRAGQGVLGVVRPSDGLGEGHQSADAAPMRGMWGRFQTMEPRVPILFDGLQELGAQQIPCGSQQPTVQDRQTSDGHRLGSCRQTDRGSRLLYLWRPLQAAKSIVSVLFGRVSAQGARREGARPKVRALCSWPGHVGLSPRLDPHLSRDDPNARRERLPHLPNDRSRPREGTSSPPHRLPEGKPGADQPDHGLPLLPRQDARAVGQSSCLERTVVRAVKRLAPTDESTYNLRVGPWHNYFAEGVLVHNCDDANDPMSVESDPVREATTRWLVEIMADRLVNLDESVIINLQQRTHEMDATGVLAGIWEAPTWVMIPMEYDPLRAMPVTLRTDDDGRPIQVWRDPRGLDEDGNELEGLYRDQNGTLKVRMGSPMAQAEGLLCWPERFSPEAVERMKKKGIYAYSGQYQQSPTVRGGGIIRRDWWLLWPDADFPALGTVVGSLDTAIKEGETNDYNAFVSMGAFAGKDGAPKLILTSAWQARMSLAELIRRTAESCYAAKVDYLLIEDKARGHDVAQEIARQYQDAPWQTILIPVNGAGSFSGDKRARLEAVSVMFSGDVRRVPMPGDPTQTMEVWTGGMIYEPGREWSQEVVDQVAAFPSGAHDDLVDALSQLLSWVRRHGVVVREAEYAAAEYEKKVYRRRPGVPYTV